LANKNFIVKNDIELKGNLIFEGATKDAFETTLAITDPTADRTITFPNSTGTVALTSDLTLENVTDGGATSTNAITITNATASSSPITGALIVTGGVGIGEDLYVDNDVYIGGNINITGSITGDLTSVDVTNLVVTDPLIYLAEGNPNDSVDIGIFAALNHGGPSYKHTGLIRDASDSGKWKLVSNLDDPISNVINFTSANFDTLKVGALEVSDAGTTRTNLGLAIGTNVQAYSSTLAAVAGETYAGDDSITTVGTIATGTWNATTIATSKGGTGLTTLGTAGQVLTVNSGATGLEWATASGGGPSTTTTSITVNTALAIESFAIATSRTAEAIIQITQGTDYYSSKVLLIHDGTSVKITEYAILESTAGAIPVTISAAISGSNLELRATITDAATTNATAKVIMTEVAV
jgi:hypothetical protein